MKIVAAFPARLTAGRQGRRHIDGPSAAAFDAFGDFLLLYARGEEQPGRGWGTVPPYPRHGTQAGGRGSVRFDSRRMQYWIPVESHFGGGLKYIVRPRDTVSRPAANGRPDGGGERDGRKSRNGGYIIQHRIVPGHDSSGAAHFYEFYIQPITLHTHQT